MDDTQMIRRITELVAIRSTADNEAALRQAVDYIAGLLEAAGNITIERFERAGKPSLLAYTGTTRPDTFDVLLNGHVDVVPAADPALFQARVQDGRLYGRGTVDMKTAALVLTDAFLEAAPTATYTLGLQIVADEEIGGANGTGLQVEEGVMAEFMLAGEFTPPGAVCVESRGICWATLRFTGRTAHSAYLWNGDNAILQATGFIDKLLKDYPVPDRDVWATTINVASLTTDNQTLNQVPATAELKLDCRYIEGDTNFLSRDTVTAYMRSLAPHAELEIMSHEPSHKAGKDDPTLRQLADAISRTTPEPVTYIRKHGAADIRYYSARGKTAVAFGVSGAGLHGDEEYVEIDSIERYRQTLRLFLDKYEKR